MFFEFVFSVCPSPNLELCGRIGDQCGWTAERVEAWFGARRHKWTFEGFTLPGLTMSVLTALDPPYQGARAPSFKPRNGALSSACHTPQAKNTHAHDRLLLFPVAVMWASDEWLNFCGYQNEEIVGQTLKPIQGPATDMEKIKEMMVAVRSRTVHSTTLVNYTKRGVPFCHTVLIEPLTDSHGLAQIFRVSSTSIVTCMQHTQ